MNKRTINGIIMAGALVVSVAIGAFASGQSQTTLAVDADAYVRGGGNANFNYGVAKPLQLRYGSAADNWAREIYLRFDLSGINGTITGGNLRLYGSSPNSGISAAVYGLSNPSETWVEGTGWGNGAGSTLCWNNKPAASSSAIDTITLSTSNAWDEWDVGAYLQAEKAAGRDLVTLVIISNSSQSTHASYNSDEDASNQPELVVTYSPPDTTPPTVSLNAPSNGSTVSDSVPVDATASDNVGVVGVQFKLDGVNLGAEDTTAPFSITWDTTTVSDGSYALSATARDAAGNSTTSSLNTVTVSNSASSETTTLAVDADAYVRGGANANRNYGVAKPLQLRYGSGSDNWAREIYVRFDLSGISGTITSGTLRLYGSSSDSGIAAAVYGLSNPSATWEEGTGWGDSAGSSLSWNNKPTASGTAIDSITLSTSNTWDEWDVGSYLQSEKAAGRDLVTLVVISNTSQTTHASYNSDEDATNQPELVVEHGGSGGSDTEAPAVSVTAPSAGATVAGSSVALSASATDNVGVVGVQFKLDGSDLGPEDTSDPFSYTWDSTSVADGAHSITAEARDAAGNTTISSSISVTVNNADGVYVAKKTLGFVSIDGVLNESVWSTDASVSKSVVGSNPDNTVTFGTLWDDNYLYLGVQILDANLYNDSTDAWRDDSIEVYIDADHNAGSTYDSFDRQFTKGYNDSSLTEKNGNVSGVLHSAGTVAGGYVIEMAIPWSGLSVTPGAGLTIGFDLGCNDDDDGGTTRETQLMWEGTNQNYQDTSNFGDVVLSSETVGSGGGSPEVNVSGNGLSIVDGDTTPSAADGTDFGSADIVTGDVVRTFNIQNTGTGTLTLSNFTSTSNEFSFLPTPPVAIGAGSNADVQVGFVPSVVGTRTATLSFSNSDSDENPYSFDVTGIGVDNGGGSEFPSDDLGPLLGGPLVNVGDGMNMGLGVSPGDVATYADDIAAAGFKWVRHRMVWKDVEATAGVYKFDGSNSGPNHDYVVNQFNSRGIGVQFILTTWGNNNVYAGQAGNMPFNSTGRQNYANYAKAAAAHFKGKKVMYEIGNEPNIKAFWPTDQNGDGTVTIAETRQSATQYADFAKVVVPAMRSSSGDPDVFIISAGLANRGGPYTGGLIGAREYMDQLRIEGALEPLFDRIGIHLYTAEGQNPVENQSFETAPEEQYIDIFRDIMDDPLANLFNTEHGWKTNNTTLQDGLQAAYNVRDFLYGISRGVRYRSWFLWNGSPGNSAYWVAGKPAYTSALVMNQQIGSYRYIRRIDTGNSEQYVFEYENAQGDKKLAAWVRDTTVNGTYQYPSSVNLTVVDMLGSQSTASSNGSTVTLSLSNYPIYVTLP